MLRDGRFNEITLIAVAGLTALLLTACPTEDPEDDASAVNSAGVDGAATSVVAVPAGTALSLHEIQALGDRLVA